MPRQFVVLGAGAVGMLFARLVAETADVLTVDLNARPDACPTGVDDLPPISHLVADVRAPSQDLRTALGAADSVLLALPEDIALATIDACAPHLAPGTLLVDTLSVKHAVAEALTVIARDQAVEALSLNPMFAPGLGFSGNPVAAIDIASGARAQELLALIRAAGARVVSVTAAEHDQLTATTQAATHAALFAFASVVTKWAEPRLLLDLAPPPHRTLLAMLARIVGGASEVYRDIQIGNPSAEAARAALAEGLVGLERALAEDGTAFADLLSGIDNWLGDDGEELRRSCGRLFHFLAEIDE